MIAIVDYGVGNLASVLNMFRRAGIDEASITSEANTISKADHILLPGVGAFDAGMENLRKSGLLPLLETKALKEKVPVLGICLGMQLMARRSEEGALPGLGWFPAETVKLRPDPSLHLKVPHMGWEYIRVKRSNPLVSTEGRHRFYFVHSYHVKCDLGEHVLATSDFGGEFTCMVNNDNIFGAQFHPEKSLRFGMDLLKRFAKL
jgi:imidazole glycerol-phosphate synthase subunit HisH